MMSLVWIEGSVVKLEEMEIFSWKTKFHLYHHPYIYDSAGNPLPLVTSEGDGGCCLAAGGPCGAKG
jgi:hypothetical protein